MSSSSPFVTVFQHIGIPYAEDVIRFVIITALLSQPILAYLPASRMMWSLSYNKQLPAVFSKVNSRGIPYVAVIVTMIGGMPGLLSEQFAPEAIFTNLLGIAAFTMVVVWMSICLSQFNFHHQWYKDGHNKSELGFAAPLFPIVPILGFIFCFITCISMVFDPTMRISFFGCLAFIASMLCKLLCVLSQ